MHLSDLQENTLSSGNMLTGLGPIPNDNVCNGVIVLCSKFGKYLESFNEMFKYGVRESSLALTLQFESFFINV